MTPRPTIFISAVSKELRSARQLVANTLQFLGYEPVWQDIFGTEQGDLRAMLRKQIDECRGVVQLVGHCYGAEPPEPDEQFGRVSYSQYEALYARQRGKKVWYLVLDTGFPSDPHETESEELLNLQADYRQRIQKDAHLFHPVTTLEGLKAKVHELRDELAKLRRRFMIWAVGVIALLVLIAALVVWVLIAVRSRRPPEAMTDERANAVFIAKDYAAAFASYVQLSDSDPENIDYHRRIEESARLGHLEKPLLERYLVLVERQSNNAMFHNYLGNAYLMLDPQDKDGKAREHYEAAVRLDARLSSPLANLGILAYRAGKPDEAESFFKRYLAAEAGDAQGWVNLGLLYVARVEGKLADTQAATDAESALRKAVQIEPGSATAYKGLGRLYATTGRKKDALHAYQRSYSLNDAQPDVRQQVELLAWESGGARFPSTRPDDFKTRGRTEDDTTAPAVIIVMRLLDQRQFQQAEAICSQWTKVEPENPLAWRLLGRAYERQGRADDMRRAFIQVETLLKRNN
jgi:Flp pilus assembly protein TadD